MNTQLRHEFVAIDEGLGNLLHINEHDRAQDWVVPIGQPQARDMQLIGDGRLLVGHNHGYTEFDLRTGAKRKEVASFSGVTSVRRLPDGKTRIVGVNTLGQAGVVLGLLDAQDRVIESRVLPGDYVRLVRETSVGTFLMMCNTHIRETDLAGNTLREIPVDGFYHAWKAVRLANGHILASAGYGAFMVELGQGGRVLQRYGGKIQVPQAVHPFFYAMFQVLGTGNVVVANWQDHGPGHGACGIQLIEFAPNGRVVWQWSEAALISSLQGLVVLDGLDVACLHDERTGVMAPL